MQNWASSSYLCAWQYNVWSFTPFQCLLRLEHMPVLWRHHIAPHPLSNSGETLLRSGLNMQKEASLKTHVSLSHYLNQQRESLETLLIYLSSAPSPPPVPHPPVSSQNFRKGRTPIRVRLYQFNLRNIPPWSCSAIYGVEYGFSHVSKHCLKTESTTV